ncbi:MAG: alpha/beta hydrolase [Nocardioidaceae bacterium]
MSTSRDSSARRRPTALRVDARRVHRVPRHVVLSAWENGFFGFDSAEVVAACRMPFMYVDAGTPNVDLEELRRLCPTLVLGRTVGAGHFHQLEVPDQVNAMIERFLVLAINDRRSSCRK